MVLLTPVVFAIAARLGVRPRPHVYACAHLSNSASLLLPVSNLTNLLAFAASGLSFTRFAALMALPWLAAIAVEFAVFRWFFATDLDADGPPPRTDDAPRVPVFVLVMVGATLAGFVVTDMLGVNPAWAAAAGAGLLAARALVRRRTTSAAVIRAAAIPFLLFVLGAGHRGAGGCRQRARRGHGSRNPSRHYASRAARTRRVGRGLGEPDQ